MVEHQVQAKYVVKDAQAMASFGRMAKAAQRINDTFNGVSRVLGGVAAVGGSVAAAFSFKEIIDSTKQHLEMVKRISVLTKTGAETADSLVETFARVGIKGHDAERMLMGMSRRAEMMDMGMQGVNRSVGGTRSLFQQLGIDVRKGIEPALLRMSKLYQQGKIDVTKIGTAFGVPRQQALKMTELLEKGPEQIKAMIAESRKFAIGEDTLRQTERMEMASNRAQAGFRRMQVLIGSEILPVLADLMEDAADRIRSWLPEVRKFAVFLRDNLQSALGIIIKIGKVLLANYAIMRMTGTGMGGWAARGLAFVRGGGAPGYGAVAGVGNILGRVPGLGGAFGGLAGMGNVSALLRVLSMVGRLSIIGVVAMVAWKAFTAIRDNALGIRDTLLGFWKRMQGHFVVIAKLFSPVAKLFSGEGVVGRFFTVVIVRVIEGITMAVEGIMMLIETIVMMIKLSTTDPKRYLLHPVDLLTDAMIETSKMHKEAMRAQEDERRAREATARETPAGRVPNVFDFRGSRFDILQKFEEGFEPDRIALAFSNDLANLGERKLQSGFSPLFAVR